VIDGIAPEVAPRARDIYGRRGGSAYSQATQPPEVDLGRISVGWVSGYNVEDGLIPLVPDFELILRAESICRKPIRYHGLARLCRTESEHCSQ
jgi:hypothetical protein